MIYLLVELGPKRSARSTSWPTTARDGSASAR